MNINRSESLLNESDQYYARSTRQILQSLKDQNIIEITVFGLLPLKKLLEIKCDIDSEAKSADHKFK